MSDPVILTGAEVISINKEVSFVNRDLCKFEQMDKQINGTIEVHVPNYRLWTTTGVDAEVLCPGKDWQRGKLKLVVKYYVEFTPDSPPPSSSPLDDLRSNLSI